MRKPWYLLSKTGKFKRINKLLDNNYLDTTDVWYKLENYQCIGHEEKYLDDIMEYIKSYYPDLYIQYLQ